MALQDLPGNVMLSILLQLDFKGIVRMQAVSKSWLSLISQYQNFWRQKLELDFGKIEGDEMDFQEEYKLDYGLRFNEPKVTDLEGHTDRVHYVTIMRSWMLSSSVDGSVILWDLATMERMHEYEMAETISFATFNEKVVFIGLENGAIHVKVLASGELRHSWQAHSDWIWFLGVSGDRLISVDRDYLVKTWDVDTFANILTFDMGTDYGCINMDGAEIFCGKSKTVHVLHQDKGLLYNLVASDRVKDVCANSNHIFGGLISGDIQVWDRQTKQCVTTMQGMESALFYMTCDSRKVISVACDGNVKIWDAHTRGCIRTVKTNKNIEKCKGYMRGKLILGLQDGTIRVSDFIH